MHEVKQFLLWAKKNHSVILAVHIPGKDKWVAEFLSCQGLASGEWALHPDVFRQICQCWGSPDVDLMASGMNAKVPRFVARYRDPQAFTVDALVLPWSHFRVPYLFPPLALLSKVVRKIKSKGIPQKIADTRSISLTAVGMHLWQALKAGYPLDVQRAGLTPAIQKTITEIIKGPTINSDLSSFQAIRSLVAPQVDIYLIRMMITLLEKERAGELENKPLGVINEQPKRQTSQTSSKLQDQGDTQPKTTMKKSDLWIEKKQPTQEIKLNIQKDSTSVVAPIQLASWNQKVLDEDTEELFSESQVQTPKRKFPDWFDASKETSKSSNIKKNKTGKKGLFG
ncbi:unnamed protein product [Ranitomeya imitator]|uniref:Helicase Helix-turn-helix domain-containing protein n=1 Tax=Ranitomeya imitator TaxID=111125 RepID=A0ABN9LF96_9NEOB|nr:unnamed protein product [Ranitomeya imitator]